ncbi:LamG domain-containing protein [Candidatus Microgenomates bacterium]|nr:LamG domain-containing protein [Candidatus Microgenomates bacterium]
MKLRSGQITVIVLLLSLMGLTIGLSQISRSLSDLKQVSYVDSGTKAYAAAETGMQYALNQLTSGTVYCPSDGTYKQVDLTNIRLGGISKLEYRVCPTRASGDLNGTIAEYPATKADDVIQMDLTANNLVTDGETPANLTNMVAQLTFNENFGLTAASNGTCGSACNGTLTNFSNVTGQDVLATSGWTKINKRWGAGALMLDGIDDYVDIPVSNGTPLDINSGNPVSIAFWVYPKSNTTQGLIFRGNGSCGYGITISNSGSNSYFSLGNSSSSFNSTTNIVLNKWHYVVGVINGASSAIYLDGNPVPDGTGNATPQNCSGNSLNIGRKPPGGNYFSGYIDNIQVYTRALSSSEVVTNFQVGTAYADRVDVIWKTTAPSSGLEVIEVDGNNLLSRYIFNFDNSNQLSGGTGFFTSYPARTACASTYCVLPASYTDSNSRCTSNYNSDPVGASANPVGSLPIPIKDTAGNHKLLRIKPLHSASYTSDILICGRNSGTYSSTLPTLGTTSYTITVLATTTNGTQKKLQALKYPSALPSVFDFAIYSNSAIVKN